MVELLRVTRRTALLGTGAILGLAACDGAAQGPSPSAALATALEQIKKDILATSPELCTSLGVSEAEAGGPYNDKLSDASIQGVRQYSALTDKFVRMLAGIPDKGLSTSEAVSKEVVLSAARFALQGTTFGYGDSGGFNAPTPYAVTQVSGGYSSVPDFLDSQHEIKNESGATNYLARLGAFARLLSQETARINIDATAGVVPPDFVLNRALGQLKKFAALPPDKTVLVESLVRRVKALPALAGRAEDFATKAIATVRDQVLPAYQAQIAALEALLPNAPKDAGVWRLPNGDNYYKAALAAWTTTERTPDDIHQIGLDQIALITAEADKGLKALGLSQGSVGERMAALGKDPKYLYPNTDAGKAALIADLNKQIAVVEARLPAYFGALPKAKVTVKRVPVYTEAGAPGGYYQSPSLDGSRPGAYYINLRDTAEWPKFSLPTLTYHEAIPGHHLQTSIAQEAGGDVPFVRKNILWFSGYGEGWALYVEQLADEMGLYATDPVGRLGYLQSAMFRAVRLVVDTGIHHKKWSREKAIDFMRGMTGNTLAEVTTEIERYCVWPGQACAYMLGKLDILALREKAKTALGSKFDIKAFHDTVLLNGAVPLDVLNKLVNAWIAKVQGA